MRTEYIWIVLTAVCWGGYPLVARSAGEAGARGTLVLIASGTLPIVASALFGAGGPWPSRAALLQIVLAGLIMGVGLLAFHALATAPMDASISIPIVDGAMLAVSAFGAMLWFGEAVTPSKLLGTALILGGIALLRPT